MSRPSVLAKRNDFSNMSAEEVYIQLMQLPCPIREELQKIIDDWPLTKCFDKYQIHMMDEFD